jgi:hypothetical protein
VSLTLLEEITQKLGVLSPDDKKAVVADAIAATANFKWIPSPGPQTDAYFSLADCLLYGGEPGGGKSQLLLGLAFNCHQRSLIMRRQYGDLERLIEDGLKIHGSRDGFNGSPPPRLRIDDNKIINFRAAQRIGDEQGTMGQGRDLLGLDEATHFAESQVRFLMGWVRSEDPQQRCRTVLATNPPLTAEGLWVNKMFAPWLDPNHPNHPNHPNPAKPGELRWVVSDEDGKDEWVNGPDDVRIVKGKIIRPTSRTYIPSSVRDNPYYAATDYERQLDSLPEPYRSLLMGGFKTTFKDADFQVIPTAWIEAAQARWKPDGYKAFAMTAMAVDPAGGGHDAEEIATRYGGWFAPLVTEKGESTSDPAKAFGHIMATRRDNAPVVVDVGGGYGDKIVLRLKDNSVPYIGFNGAGKALGRALGSNIPFANKRAEGLWRFREALDPDQQGGSAIALPPDPELKADLAAPCYDAHALQVRGVYLIESKEDLRKRLGRSTGKGDAVVMCLSEGNAAVKRAQNSSGPRQTTANRGYEHLKTRR